jgi:hypothetical protein
VGQANGQPSLDLPPRPRNDDPPPAAFFHDQLGETEEAIVLEGLRMKDVGQFLWGVFPEGAEAKPVLQFCGMPAAVLLGGEVVIDGPRLHIDLVGDKRDQGRRRPSAMIGSRASERLATMRPPTAHPPSGFLPLAVKLLNCFDVFHSHMQLLNNLKCFR